MDKKLEARITRLERLLTTKNEGYELDKIIKARQTLSSIQSMIYDLEEILKGVGNRRIEPAVMKLNGAIFDMRSVLEDCEAIAKRNV